MATYNGWTNRETWLINVWYNPESKNDVDYAREDLEAKLDDIDPILKDFINDGVINWDELKEAFEDEDEEEEDEDEDEEEEEDEDEDEEEEE